MNRLKAVLLSFICVSLILGVVPISFAQKVPTPLEYNTPLDYQRATGKKITKFSEAPGLAELVKQGKLPPVEKRLPQEPKVIVPVEEVGQYGGVWNRAWLGPSDSMGVYKSIGRESLIDYDAFGKTLVPNIVKRWVVSKDSKVYTLYLRKGIKWSDGQPFTADDILFVYEDVLMNKELTPTFPQWLTVKGKPVKVEKVDDYTIKFIFDEPMPLFLYQLAKPIDANALLYAPKHYMKQFHPKYTSKEELDKKIKEAGVKTWNELYTTKEDSWWVNDPERPTIWSWKAVTSPTGPNFRLERNPYYWKVDVAGNQLPYINTVNNILVQNTEMVNLKAMTGELDFQWRHISAANYTLFMENREKGGYRVLNWRSTSGSNHVICFNLTCKDPVLKSLFNNDKFRKALSIAINREEINQIAYLGQAVPRQASLIPDVPYYSPEWEKAWAEYDPKKASAMLDEIGLSKKDKDGYRLRPDGKRLDITIEFMEAIGFSGDVCELIRKYWEDIGIKVALKPEERSLYKTRQSGNELEVYIEGMSPQIPFWSQDKWIIPSVSLDHWGIEFARWYVTGGKSGVEPPKDIARLFELWDKAKSALTETQRKRFVQEMVNLHVKNIWFIGTVGMAPTYAIVKNTFRNVPENIMDAALDTPRQARPEQFFIKSK